MRLTISSVVSGSVLLVTGCLVDRGPIGGGPPDAGFDAPFNDVGMPDAWSPDAFRVDAPVDAFRPIDAFADDSPDAVVLRDTNEPIDAWAPDAHEPPDAPTPRDAFVPQDVFTPLDAFTPPDAFAPPDAFTPPPDVFTPECTEGATRCVGATGLQLDRCVGGRWTRQADCSALGCGASASDPNAHCLRLVPSNVPASEMRGGDAVTVSAAGTINTTACAGGAGIPATAFRMVGGYCVLSVASLRLATGQVELVGTLPLIVLSTGDVTIDASFSLVGRTTATGGAGESAFGAGGDGMDDSSDNSGGGGGGSFCGTGGAGGAGGTGGAPGTAVAASLLTPLRGGSRGGVGSGQTDLRGAGGRGGGGLQISSGGTITVNGAISAAGGGGRGGPGTRPGVSRSRGAGGCPRGSIARGPGRSSPARPNTGGFPSGTRRRRCPRGGSSSG